MIRVGFFCHGAWPWDRQTPDHDGIFGQCKFVFNGKGPFDYVVVYDGLSEKLNVPLPKERMLFVCSEPMNVKRYLPEFVQQFGHLISADPELEHPHRIQIQAGLPWHYGIKTASPDLHPLALNYRQIEADQTAKTKVLSVICSNKTFTPEHRRRIAFVEALKAIMGDKLDVFGRGFREIDDKAEVLAPYKYHVALENCDFADYWTEKISDPFLGGAFPFYWGCRNLERYYPADSFIRVDLDDPEGSARIIAAAIEDNTFEKRQAALQQAKKLTLEKHNLFAMLEEQIVAIEAGQPPQAGRKTTLYKERHFLPRPAALRAVLVDTIRHWPFLFKLLKRIHFHLLTQKGLLQIWAYKKGSRIKHWLRYGTESFYRNHQRWLKAQGEEVLRFQYDLKPGSVVFDVGGFEGNWAAEINRRFGSRIYVFEPVAAFVKTLQERLGNNPNISIHPYGLAGTDSRESITLLHDASSLFQPGPNKEEILLRNVKPVLEELGITHIDLMKINIEGGEFPLLERLIETGDIKNVADIQVQFHPFVTNASARYAALAKHLRKTHTLTWSYPFVWENWRRKVDHA